MDLIGKYKLSDYQEYGLLGNKENIYLVRNRNTGKICVKKVLDQSQKEIIEFRKENSSCFFPQLEKVIPQEHGYVIIESYVEGITLEEFMMGEPLEEPLAVKFAVQICQALQELHEHKPMIVYRDLKPENIMVDAQNHIKLIDFDISRCYQEGKSRDTELFGTAEYAAPEQFGYFQTDNRTDIYAFGVLLNYMLTAKFPVEQIAEGKYQKMIRKCTELEPAKRYQKIEEILDALPKDSTCTEIQKPLSWALPGFRSRELWKKIIAVLGYVLIFYFGVTLNFTDQGVPYGAAVQWINRIAFILSQGAAVLIIFDYRGISKGSKSLKGPWNLKKILIAMGISLICLCIGSICAALIEEVFHL